MTAVVVPWSVSGHRRPLEVVTGEEPVVPTPPETGSVTKPLAATGERAVGGGEFIFGEPMDVPAIWGYREQVLMAAGEALMIAGQQGIGKTTLAQQWVLRRIGLRRDPLLGLPVAVDERPVLYLAMDRPRQAARSMRRMTKPSDRELLDERLGVWRGPLPLDITRSVPALADWVAKTGAGSVVVDSVKDLVPGINNDEVGSALNMAWQELIARGIELLLLHHPRKATADGKVGNKIDDIYGSKWLTAGLGSVIVLTGEPGAEIVGMHHVKQPAEPVGPFLIHHDHERGEPTAEGPRVSLLDTLLGFALDEGADAKLLALAVYGGNDGAKVKKIQRDLQRLQEDGLAVVVAGKHTGSGRTGDRWFASEAARFAATRGGEMPTMEEG